MQNKKYKIFLPILIIAPIIVAIFCVGIGRYPISYLDVIKSCVQHFGLDMGVDYTTYSFVINHRTPRILLALLCGAGLAAAGCAIQALFSNPLATPDTLGVSAGAGFGAALAILLGLGAIMIQLVAFGLGILAVGISYYLSRKNGKSSIIMIILSGVIVASIFNALISLIQVMAEPTQQLPQIVFWLMGDLSKASYNKIALMLPFVISGIAIIFALRWRLNIVSLSETEAISLGVNVKKMRILIIVAATLITAASVATCGIIGWVGMLIPHIARMIFGVNNRYIVPASISFGAVFLMIIDTLARSLTTGEIPISILTAIIGAPIFIILLKRTGGTI